MISNENEELKNEKELSGNDNSVENENSDSTEIQIKQSEEIVKHESEKNILPEQENPVDTSNVQSGEVIGKYESEEEYKKAIELVEKDINEHRKFIDISTDWKEIRLKLNDTKDKLKALFLKKEDNDRILNEINDLFKLLADKQSEEREKIDAESEDNYNKLKELVDHAIKTAENANDFKEAREGLIKVQDKFRGLRLRRKHRDELLDDINKAFEALQKRQAIERENFEMETIENYHSLKKIIDDAISFSKNTVQFGKARQRLIEAQGQIKGKKLKRDQRNELYQVIRDAFNDLNERQEADRELFEKETKINYENLRKIVDEAIAFANDSSDYKEAREALINAQGTIKGMKLKRNQRDELYSDIREIFNKINESQEKEREEFDQEAVDNYSRLTEKVDDAFDLVHGVNDFRLIRETLIAIQSEVKIVKLKRSQRNELFARIREAFSIFDKKKDEYFNERRNEKKSKLEAIVNNLNDKIKRLSDSVENKKKELEQEEAKLDNSELTDEEKSEITSKIQELKDTIQNDEKTIESDKLRIEDVKKELKEEDNK